MNSFFTEPVPPTSISTRRLSRALSASLPPGRVGSASLDDLDTQGVSEPVSVLSVWPAE